MLLHRSKQKSAHFFVVFVFRTQTIRPGLEKIYFAGVSLNVGVFERKGFWVPLGRNPGRRTCRRRVACLASPPPPIGQARSRAQNNPDLHDRASLEPSAAGRHEAPRFSLGLKVMGVLTVLVASAGLAWPNKRFCLLPWHGSTAAVLWAFGRRRINIGVGRSQVSSQPAACSLTSLTPVCMPGRSL